MDWLGLTVRDRISGFVGVVTGHVRYLTGCNQLLVQPRVGGDGKWIDSQWVDESRASIDTSHERVTLPVIDPGPDKVAPRR